MIAPSSPLVSAVQGRETPLTNVTNVVSSNTMTCIDFSHSVFSAKVVNRRAFNLDTWVINIGATDHIVCSVSVLSAITLLLMPLLNCLMGKPL